MAQKADAQGYLYQAMACVLSAVREDRSVCVQLEPDFADEKVDIAFRYRDESCHAVQVKASAEPVTEAELADWLERFVRRTPNASSYRFMLIGPCGDKAGDIIGSVGKSGKAAGRMPGGLGRDIRSVGEKLVAEAFDNDFGFFESRIVAELGALLQYHGYSADFAQLRFIAGAICYRFNKFATNSKYIPGPALTRKIIEWIELFYPVVVSQKRKNAGFQLRYYFDSRFLEPPCSLQYDLTHSELVKQKQSELRSLAADISGLHLPPQPAPEAVEGYAEPAYCEYAVETQNDIAKKARAVLRLTLPPDFFHVGSLTDTGAERGCDGTALELDKYKKLERFRQGLEYLYSLLRIFAQLQALHVVPLALCNTGELAGQSIRVQIALPRDVALLTERAFPRPEPNVMGDLTGEDGLLHRILKQSTDGNVRAYPAPYYASNHYSYLFFGPHRKEQEQKELSDDFEAYLKSLFCFSVLDDDPGYRIIELEFEALAAGECMALPCFLFVQADKSFTIKYRITSRELSIAQVGRLEYDIR
jgi:hypothetical protein